MAVLLPVWLLDAAVDGVAGGIEASQATFHAFDAELLPVCPLFLRQPTQALQNTAWRQLSLRRLPGKVLVFYHIASQEQLPWCRADQHCPAIATDCRVQAQYGLAQILLAETGSRLGRPLC